MTGTSQVRSLIGIGLVMILFAAGFQNCGRDLSKDLSGASNGQGYDGKTFAHYDQNGQCTESLVSSAIRFRNGSAYLIRDNCQDIPEAQQVVIQDQIQYLTPDTLIYHDLIYFAYLSFSKVSGAPNGSVLVFGDEYKIDGVFWRYQNSRRYIASRDRAGTSLWMKGHSWFADLPLGIAMDSGGLVMTNLTDGSTGFAGAWLSRITPAGTMTWNKALQGLANNGPPSVSGGVELSGGRFLLTGSVPTNPSLANQNFMALLSANGDLVSAQTLSVPSVFSPTVQRARSGEIYFTVANIPFVGRMNEQGQVLWSRRFDSFDHIEMAVADNGRVVVTGVFYSQVVAGFTLPSYRFILLDSDGNILASRKWLADQTIDPSPKLTSSGDGGFLAKQDNGSNVVYTRFDGDLNLSWAVKFPLPRETEHGATFAFPDGRIIQSLLANSTVRVSPYSSTTFLTTIVRTILLGSNCPGCSSHASAPMVAVGAPVTSAGPGLIPFPVLETKDVTPPPFEELQHNLIGE